MKITSIKPEFVDYIPAQLQDGIIYISQKFGTAAHRCCCGCGVKIVTPLVPTEWTLTIVGNAITLSPSVGNWNHPCQSHYLIRANKVIWVGAMTKNQIEFGRVKDRINKDTYFGKLRLPNPSQDKNREDIIQLRNIFRWFKSTLMKHF